MQPEDVAWYGRLSLHEKNPAQLTLLPEVCTRLVAMYYRAGWETCAWCMFMSSAHSIVKKKSWILFKILFSNSTGEGRDDTGNSGGEGDGGETCWERPRWTKHESQTGSTQVIHQSPLNINKLWVCCSMNCLMLTNVAVILHSTAGLTRHSSGL